MVKVIKGIKLRCYPNERQRNMLPQMFGNNRKVWNELINAQQELYKKNKGTGEKTYYSKYDMNKLITQMKHSDNFAYLKYSDAGALQILSEDLDNAFKRFFKKQSGFPKFKSRKNKQSYTSRCQRQSIHPVSRHKIFITKLKEVRIQPYIIRGTIKRATISQTPSGKYFISLAIEQEIADKEQTGKAIGIDLGLRNIANLSNGRKFKSLHFKELDRQIALWQRKYSRRLAKAKRRYLKDLHEIKTQRNGYGFINEYELYRNLEPSERRGVQQARKRIAKLYEKKANKRKDYLQKLSTELINKYDFIAFENLNVKGMQKNHKLSRAISNQGWRIFVGMCEYKSAWHNKIVIKVKPAYTTQTCYDCGYVRTGDEKLNLGVKRWVCTNCGVIHDRDINAARNILNKAYHN